MAEANSEIEQILDLAIQNEWIERELIIAAHYREAATATALRNQLSSGLLAASNLARKIRGLPSVREETRRNRDTAKT